jgi:hypothetical protein
MLEIHSPQGISVGATAQFMLTDRLSELTRPVRCSFENCQKWATILHDDKPFCGRHAPDPPNIVAARRAARGRDRN